MKQDEAEWVEYEKVMEDVIEKSGLDKDIFYDVRGNHDAFGVPTIGGLFDFYSKHSINARLGRSGQVNSVTVQVSCSLEHFTIIFLAYMLLFNVSKNKIRLHLKFLNVLTWMALENLFFTFAVTFHSASSE